MPNVLLSALPQTSDHEPVLTHEVLELVDVEPGDTVVDGTFGAGGHASYLAGALAGSGKLIAIDRDPSVEPYFDAFAGSTSVNTRLLRGEFDVVFRQLAQNGVRVDAVLLDLGMSSMQVDQPERGFSYAVDAPLDMRMDPSAPVTAADLVNTLPESDLADAFRRYGEERHARPIARAIVSRRSERPYARTKELVETIKQAVSAPRRFGDGHPAKRVFQALRIAVNDELGSLERALPAALELLEPGGRLVVISFQSLEDRLVKHFFKAQVDPCTCPPDLPVCACGLTPQMELVTRKAIRPSPQEVADNPRSASARLRVAQRTIAEAGI
jgi:16S rRNA (cytosine1402-N4)-methyltransferase